MFPDSDADTASSYEGMSSIGVAHDELVEPLEVELVVSGETAVPALGIADNGFATGSEPSEDSPGDFDL